MVPVSGLSSVIDKWLCGFIWLPWAHWPGPLELIGAPLVPYWRLWGPLGGSLASLGRLPGVFGESLGRLGASPGVFLDASLGPRVPLGYSGCLWVPLGASGCLWVPLGASGCLWVKMACAHQSIPEL